ncbi:MAG: multicopper oxidase domain-containing protein [Kofleriaceae bacterium]|nr:multicopper oxidase domain-containing protein [Kofleriaceae bacterium]
MTHVRDVPGPVTLPRRSFLQLCGLASASLLLPSHAGCGDNVPATEPSTGDALPIPAQLEGELIAGVRVFRLQMQPGTVTWVPDAPTATYGINGDYLGPTLRLRRGERTRIEVSNGLSETSTLHWHGIELPARADGGPYQPIAPGTTWVSEFDVVQRPTTAWYHPHQMHATGRQVYMGMAGLIQIDDPAAPELQLPTTYGIDDFPLVLQDRRLFADGSHPYSSGGSLAMHDMMAGLKGDIMLVNGKVSPRGTLPQGWVRLRLLNGSNARNYLLGFGDDRAFQQIASDGGLLAAPLTSKRLLLGPGERAEILLDLRNDATGSEFKLRSFSNESYSQLFAGQMGSNLADTRDREAFDIMTIVVGPPLMTEVVPPSVFAPITAPNVALATTTRRLTLAMAMGNVTINGARMLDLANVPAAIDFRIARGSVEVWEVVNTSGMAHPLHVHNQQFQVVDVAGAAPLPHLQGWKDTVIIPPNQTVRLLLHFDSVADAASPYMFHCHILEHEDHGMMGRFFIV